MYAYDIEWVVNDHGAQVGKLRLHLPESVRIADVTRESFNVFVARKDENGEVITYRPYFFKNEEIQARGYRTILAAYPSDEKGHPISIGNFITLELDVSDLQSRTIIGGIHSSKFVSCDYRVTQIAPIGNVSGWVFDELKEIYCDQTMQWIHETSNYESLPLQYAYYNPMKIERRPIIIWFHGAGEGGTDVRLAYMGNNVVALSSEKIQSYFGGAWVLAPQSPTMWMDDGSHTYGRTGKSMYKEALKAVIDEFIESHSVDTDRIYIGGCSNGGFMTMRMVIDYPNFFAGAYPMCEALYEDTISNEQIEAISQVPIWFLHAMTDSLVKAEETSVPTYHRLKTANAQNVHLTYIDDRPPFEMINHGCWIQGLRDEYNVDLDGSLVKVEGKPVTRFQWLAHQKR